MQKVSEYLEQREKNRKIIRNIIFFLVAGSIGLALML